MRFAKIAHVPYPADAKHLSNSGISVQWDRKEPDPVVKKRIQRKAVLFAAAFSAAVLVCVYLVVYSAINLYQTHNLFYLLATAGCGFFVWNFLAIAAKAVRSIGYLRAEARPEGLTFTDHRLIYDSGTYWPEDGPNRLGPIKDPSLGSFSKLPPLMIARSNHSGNGLDEDRRSEVILFENSHRPGDPVAEIRLHGRKPHSLLLQAGRRSRKKPGWVTYDNRIEVGVDLTSTSRKELYKLIAVWAEEGLGAVEKLCVGKLS